MEGDTVRLIIWGVFGCFGFVVFLLILRALSRLEEADQSNATAPKPDMEKLPSLARKRNALGALISTERSAPVVPTILRDLSLAKLQEATDQFNALNLIKIGNSGDFFAGVLEDDEHIVVKRMDDSKSERMMQTEMEIHATQQSHRYVVPLLGQCSEARQKLFVYKFISKGDLATALTRCRPAVSALSADGRRTEKSIMESLPWITRLKIATETAQALCYLHFDCQPPILHKDIKSSSILLTEEYEVRLGSLSHAQKINDNGGNLLSYDIFCFGKVLLDLISGLDVSGAEDPYAESWVAKAMPYIESDSYSDGLLALIDPSLVVEEDFTREILGVAVLARACLNPTSLKTLNMKVICEALHNPNQVLHG